MDLTYYFRNIVRFGEEKRPAEGGKEKNIKIGGAKCAAHLSGRPPEGGRISWTIRGRPGVFFGRMAIAGTAEGRHQDPN